MKMKTKHVGIGGIKCPCCRTGTLAQAKRDVNREQRRRGRQEVREMRAMS